MEMAKQDFKNNLPHQTGGIYLLDGGAETTMIFHENLELAHFAAFVLVNTSDGREALKRYFRNHANVAVRNHVGFIFETPTWRASADWGEMLGYDAKSLAQVNRDAVELLEDIRDEYAGTQSRFLMSGCIGPRGDGYTISLAMSAAEAQAYHTPQVKTLAQAGVDMVSAITMTYPDEAIGVVRAAQSAQVPVVISFTVETDGWLPSGHTIGEAIEIVDTATGDGPAYYMINCAHPTHFWDAITSGGAWVKRIGGLRANASRMSHAELDDAVELDEGNPLQLGQEYRQLRHIIPSINVMGGCCGTDHRHISAICDAITIDIAA